MTQLTDIEKRTKAFADARADVTGIVTVLNDGIDALKRDNMPALKRCIAKVAERHDNLRALIDANPQLFTKPKTVVFHGVKVGFAKGNYLNPGPWRIPYHHRTLLHYCKAFGVALEPFIQLNHQALVHNSKAFGGKPQRYRELAADWDGNVAELLAKAIDNKGLDSELRAEDRDRL